MRSSSRSSVSPSRQVAFTALRKWDEGGAFIEDLLEEGWGQIPLSPEDRRLSQALVYGVFRNRRTLDFWIDRLAAQGIGSLPPQALDILRLGFLQLAFMDRIPAHAAVNESVALCEAGGLPGLKGLVNALLRGFSRRREFLQQELERQPDNLELRTSHPGWLTAWAEDRMSREKAGIWLCANNQQPHLYLYPILSRLGSPPGAKGEWSDQEACEALRTRLSLGEVTPDGAAVVLPPGTIPMDLEAFREGCASVQDIAARQAVEMLQPRPGERILDLCSAPGGKTIQIADRAGQSAEILSVDANERRLCQVLENLRRCKMEWVRTARRDLLEAWPEREASADAVLIDVPCSGLGTLKRKVDLRYRLKPEDIPELASKARRLLAHAARLTRAGGRLVYSTCTLTREENEQTVRAFLSTRSGAWELNEEKVFPPWLGDEVGVETVTPSDCDASYCALLIRKK